MSKIAKGLVAYAKAMVGLPYWYGTFGNTGTKQLLNSKRKQYPRYYTAKDFDKQIGKRVHDCVGLIKGYLWSTTTWSVPKYNSKQDVSAAGMYAVSKEKGKISGMKMEDGALVYKSDSTKLPGHIHHVGVYSKTDNCVYEAKGHAWGVVKTPWKKSEWHFWSECPWIDYENNSEEKKRTVEPANYFNKDVAGKYKTTEHCNLRYGGGLNKEVIKELHSKVTVNCFGYYQYRDGRNWLLIKTQDGIVGYISINCLRRSK